MKKHRHPYTMVEMLMVIVLATILFGIGIPAFLTMIRGNTMTIATRELSACIQSARAHAVTNNTYTAMLFLSNESGISVKSKYAFYRVCTVINVSDSWNFEGWIEGEDWRALPDGILMSQMESNEYGFQNAVSVENVSLKDFNDSPDSPDSLDSVKVIRALIFKPDGKTVNATISIPLFHARNVGGTYIFTDQQDGKTPYQVIQVNQFTGKITVKTPKPVEVNSL